MVFAECKSREGGNESEQPKFRCFKNQNLNKGVIMSNGEKIQNGFQRYCGMLRFYDQHPSGKMRAFFHRGDRRQNKRILRQTFRSNHSALGLRPVFSNRKEAI